MTLEDTLVRESGIDIVRHAIVSEYRIQVLVSDILNIPREILRWDKDARCRYVECAKKGTQTIHRARAMIVGCAGAGKTTLLKRLQKRSLHELQQVQSTIGLEVHEEVFEIAEDKADLRSFTDNSNKEGKALLSVMDFGGQCAYYACHQVYLSRRAFYLLVIDMSKSFNERIDRKFCDQEETMFADWTYGEYILFWMKSVHMYCDETAPVILVGTHLDKSTGQTTDTFYNSILEHLRFDKNLKKHLDRKRCFLVGLHSINDPSFNDLSDLMFCIASIAKEDRWKETIPADWALGESTLRYLRGQNRRIISKAEFQKECFGTIIEKYEQVPDILKLFHEIGVILNFREGVLSETVIIDIQWFVDAFKNIITDLNNVMDNVKNEEDWQNFYQNGYILDSLLEEIWSSKSFNVGSFKPKILQYMQRLGLLVVGDNQHYIPCMNKCTFDAAHEDSFKRWKNKTSVLVLRFQFLPYFIFCRLVVACITRTDGEWGFLNDQGLRLFKNVACFAYKGHGVALAVNHSSIQVQVFKPGNSFLEKKVTLEVRSTIERLLKELTGTFHKEIMYIAGYQCSMYEVFTEYNGCFVEETAIQRKGQMVCPRHALLHHHVLCESDILGYWKQDCGIQNAVEAASRQDNFIVAYEEGLRKFNFKTFEHLTKVGRDALQIYFDKEFPLRDLVSMSSRQENFRKVFRLNDGQCAKLFPADKSNPSSEKFDVTMMYTMLRNRYPRLQAPTKGWGRTPDTSDIRLTDDVERIRIYRNEIGHATEATSKLEKKELEEKARDLMEAILRLSNGVLKQEMMNALEGRT
ncbi:probable serine/threonine-protein kinase pats1 [Saccostrea cucullata]|uniref:probable serine/threonine-protein kinase pats1 n=1 Tax=Saccostrea cuccullata TaxID=36930 RepID=UPI002ED25A4A